MSSANMSVNWTFASGFHPCSSSAVVPMAMLFNVTRVCLLLPLSASILVLGCRRWRRRSLHAMSHVDALTYHNAALELICNVVAAAYEYGSYRGIWPLQAVGWWICWLALCGEISFHLLTCMERYLAVVHPVTYRGLRTARGLRIRNGSIGCAWLLSVACSTVASVDAVDFIPQLLCVLLFALLVVSFCSISVLRALTRPGPGGERERPEPKRRASLTIMAITAVLWLWLAGLAVCVSVGASLQCERLEEELRSSGYWCMMPGSLVLPLLYLHRTGRIRCSRKQSQ